MDNRNVFVAIALSMSVLLFWGAFFETPKNNIENQTNKQIEKKDNSIQPSANQAPEINQLNIEKKISRNESIKKSDRIKIENNNIVTGQNTPSATTHTTTSNSTYTRKQLVSQYQGYNVYRMDIDNPDTTISRTRDVTIAESSDYRYYDVMATAAEEVENFDANVAVVFPIDIMMRRLETAFGGNQLDWSFIKVAENMNAANAEVLHLKETYGVTAIAVPLKMTVGANFVKITSNQLEDFDTFGAQTDDILQYYETENLQKVWRNVTLNHTLSETYENKIFMDYDTPSDRTNNLAFSSVQSICMFLIGHF